MLDAVDSRRHTIIYLSDVVTGSIVHPALVSLAKAYPGEVKILVVGLTAGIRTAMKPLNITTLPALLLFIEGEWFAGALGPGCAEQVEQWKSRFLQVETARAASPSRRAASSSMANADMSIELLGIWEQLAKQFALQSAHDRRARITADRVEAVDSREGSERP